MGVIVSAAFDESALKSWDNHTKQERQSKSQPNTVHVLLRLLPEKSLEPARRHFVW